MFYVRPPVCSSINTVEGGWVCEKVADYKFRPAGQLSSQLTKKSYTCARIDAHDSFADRSATTRER